jgi:hypothetical protein
MDTVAWGRHDLPIWIDLRMLWMASFGSIYALPSEWTHGER